jgi:X-linked retinitis pigmentosa GTPase regulator
MCGSNQYGELGIVGHDKIPLPSHLSFAFPIKEVACGVFYTLILTKAGQVYSFGNNKYGQLGIGNRTTQAKPILVEGLEEVVTISAGYHSGAVDKFGNLYIWGSGSFGEYLKPRKYVMQVPIRDVCIRGFFGVALGESAKTGTQLFCWGNNTYGELGNGSV